MGQPYSVAQKATAACFKVGFASEDLISKTTTGGEKQKISPRSRSVDRLHGASYIHLEMSEVDTCVWLSGGDEHHCAF